DSSDIIGSARVGVESTDGIIQGRGAARLIIQSAPRAQGGNLVADDRRINSAERTEVIDATTVDMRRIACEEVGSRKAGCVVGNRAVQDRERTTVHDAAVVVLDRAVLDSERANILNSAVEAIHNVAVVDRERSVERVSDAAILPGRVSPGDRQSRDGGHE